MRKYSYTPEQLADAVAQSKSFRELHQRLDLKGYNYQSLHRQIERHGWRRGDPFEHAVQDDDL